MRISMGGDDAIGFASGRFLQPAEAPGEAGQPRRDGDAASDVRVARLNAIVDWLAAESSPRYQRTAFTFCNVCGSVPTGRSPGPATSRSSCPKRHRRWRSVTPTGMS